MNLNIIMDCNIRHRISVREVVKPAQEVTSYSRSGHFLCHAPISTELVFSVKQSNSWKLPLIPFADKNDHIMIGRNEVLMLRLFCPDGLIKNIFFYAWYNIMATFP